MEEKKKRDWVIQIQTLYQEGCCISEISRRMGITRTTVKKYKTGDPNLLCRKQNRGGIFYKEKEFILNALQNGVTQAEIIHQLQKKYGYPKSRAQGYAYMGELIKKYGLNVAKYSSSTKTVPLFQNIGSKNKNYTYITRKGVFQHLFLKQKLSKEHHEYNFLISKFMDIRKLYS